MSEPTPDDKIARLVHLVLEAVDQRLEGLRHELQQLHTRLGEVEKSIARGSTAGKATATQPDRRVDQLSDEIRSIRAQLEALAARPQPTLPASPISPSPVGSVAPTAPVAPTTPVAPSASSPGIDTSLPTLQPLLASSSATTTGEHPELIDLDRLNDLLTAKLGQLNLPRPG